MKLRFFFFAKITNSGSHLTFFKRNAITRTDLPYGAVPGAPHLHSKNFFGLQLCLTRGCCENPKSTRALPSLREARGAVPP